ncbi:HutD/Ves family protein [Phenylobacterium montanum]|uniref:HutD family protein n=1 Tax=Phenylobacterium montanum TaxID=2823693 RepID=A0A975IWY6_9CAUL|nr:HutD family protein [Caulobacter sp. S6]QUD90074.1 HutD family protein [Caulobacter sp. S6]
MRLIRTAEHRVMPWKNGLGSTTEIAVSPERARLEDFDWRVSMASVTTDGPFSAFAGVDRTLSVMDGAGIRLQVAGRGAETLSPASPPYAFPGDQPTEAWLIDGPITDLNVMSRRGRLRHKVERLVLSTPLERPAPAAATLVLCRCGLVRIGGGDAELGPLDGALFEAPAPALKLTPVKASEVFWIEFDPV